VVANSVAPAEQIISGLILIVQNHREVITSQTERNIDRLGIGPLGRFKPRSKRHAHASFDFIIQRLIVEGPERCISVDNIAGLVAVLCRWDCGRGGAATRSAARSVLINPGEQPHNDNRFGTLSLT
jgi:hypothetical protein